MSCTTTHVRIVCVSDTHNKDLVANRIPDGDVLIHAGDFSSTGVLSECTSFRNWMDSLPHQQKVVIAGNHDITLQPSFYQANGEDFHRKLFRRRSFDPVAYSAQCRAVVTTNGPGYHYLEDSGNLVLGSSLSVFGSPWQPEFCDWAFNLPRGAQLKAKWDMIPTDTDVLVTHGPPHGILDMAPDGRLCGCEELLATIRERVKPRMHIFGHIHEGYGTYFDGTTLFVNASICTGAYRPTNKPIVIDLPLDSSQPAIVVSIH